MRWRFPSARRPNKLGMNVIRINLKLTRCVYWDARMPETVEYWCFTNKSSWWRSAGARVSSVCLCSVALDLRNGRPHNINISSPFLKLTYLCEADLFVSLASVNTALFWYNVSNSTYRVVQPPWRPHQACANRVTISWTVPMFSSVMPSHLNCTIGMQTLTRHGCLAGAHA